MKVRIQKLAAALLAAAALAGGLPARAQSLQIGDTGISVLTARSATGAVAEWRGLQGNPKVANLVAFAQQELGTSLTPVPTAGFVTDTAVRYARQSSTSDLVVRTAVIPLAGNATRYRGGTAVILASWYTSTPSLVVPRLLIRRDPGSWHAVEYSFRKDGRVTEMAARFGDCLFRSALKALEEKNPAAHQSLRRVLDASARPGAHLVDGLRQVYDVRGVPVGQGEMLLANALVTAANVEEEYQAGFISGTLEQNFKPERRDNKYIAQAKQLAKHVLSSLLKQAGKALWEIIKNYFKFF